MKHLEAFERETQLHDAYTVDKAYTVWAMGLYLNTSDLLQLASDYLTDASDDHKIDFLLFDEDEKTLLVTQGYHSNKVAESAKSNKASDLNTAMAWLFKGDIKEFNDSMRSKVVEIRQALDTGKLLNIELVFAHNCGESKEVDKELKTASSFLKDLLKEYNVDVTYRELGNSSLEDIFLKKIAHITINDDIICPFPVNYEEGASCWQSAVITVSGDWLRSLYVQYETQLFSANYRGYLGESRNRINKAIKSSAERQPTDFWAFNNGITILTSRYDSNGHTTTLHGMSIINGAQTTGSLGQIPSEIPLGDVKIMARIIQCSDQDMIGKIVKYNNSQNQITAWDSYGNDPEQLELQRELKSLNYDYSIKRGFDSRYNILNIETIIQPLLAFLGKYKDAGRSKTTLFDTHSLYSDAFDHTKARHVIFIACLSSALYSIRDSYKQKVQQEGHSKMDENVNRIFQHLRARYFLMALIGEFLTKQYKQLTDKSAISFTPAVSDQNVVKFSDLVEIIKPAILKIIIAIASYDKENGLMSHYADSSAFDAIVNHCETAIAMVTSEETGEKIFSDFGSIICNG